MYKDIFLLGLLCALAGYFLADKLLLRATEQTPDSYPRGLAVGNIASPRLVVVMLIGVGNNITLDNSNPHPKETS